MSVSVLIVPTPALERGSSTLSSRSLQATAMGRNVAGLGGGLTRHDGGRRIGKNRDTPV